MRLILINYFTLIFIVFVAVCAEASPSFKHLTIKGKVTEVNQTSSIFDVEINECLESDLSGISVEPPKDQLEKFCTKSVAKTIKVICSKDIDCKKIKIGTKVLVLKTIRHEKKISEFYRITKVLN